MMELIKSFVLSFFYTRTAQHPISTRDMTVNAVTDCLSLAPVVAATDAPQVKKAYFYVFEHSTKDGLYNYHVRLRLSIR
jgi:hypothetical protein